MYAKREPLFWFVERISPLPLKCVSLVSSISVHRTARTDGYFGNLRQTNNGMIDTTFIVQNLMLTGERGLMGRSVVVSTLFAIISTMPLVNTKTYRLGLWLTMCEDDTRNL